MSDPFDDAVGATLQGNAAQIRDNVAQALPVNPDAEAQTRQYAATAGVPLATARAMPDQVKQQAQMSAFDASVLQRHFPTTAQLLANPDLARITHDDIPGTTAVETAIKAPVKADSAITNPAPGKPFSIMPALSGMANYLASADGDNGLIYDVGSGVHSLLQGLGGGFNKLAEAVGIVTGAGAVIADKVRGDSTASDWWFRHTVTPEVENEGAFNLSKDASWSDKGFHAAGQLMSMLSQIVLTGGGGAVTPIAAADTAAAGVAKLAAHGIKAMAAPALTEAVNTGREVYTATGDGDAAFKAAAAAYGTNSAMGVVPISAEGGLLKRLTTGAFSGFASGELSRKAMNAALPDNMQTPFTWENALLSAATGSVLAGVMGPRGEPLSTLPGVRETYTEAYQAAKAEAQSEQLVQIAKAAGASKLRERDPAAFKEFVAQAADGSDLQSVHIEGQAFAQMLEKAGITGEEIRQTMPDVASQLDAALGENAPRNGLVSIPIEDFATHIAGSKIQDEFLQHARVSPEGSTVGESEAFKKTQQDDMQQRAQQIADAHVENQAYQSSVDRMNAQIDANLSALKMRPDQLAANSALLKAFYVTQADRLGMQPHEFAEKYPVTASNKVLATARQESLDQSVSTRVPTAVKAKENPLSEMLTVGLPASKADPKAFAKNVKVVEGYSNYRDAPSAKTPDQKAERFINHVRDNLLWLHDQIDAKTRNRSKLWYDGARAIVDRWSPKFGLTDAQTSGVLAVLSPQKDWFMNVSLGERIMDAMKNHLETNWSPEMTATAERIFGKPQYKAAVAEIAGKKLGELKDPFLKAMWIRAFDEAHNDRNYRLVTPEGGFGEHVTNADGKTRSKSGWGSLNEIAKAVSIIEDGSIPNISAKLGGQHKVRNFYNNIFDPHDKHGSVTIDTHAVAAGLLRPLSGSSPEVEQNFGGGGSASSSEFGSQGTYGLYAEAYRRAAAARGLLPREMQSITWEAVRGLFPAGFKSQAKNVDAAHAVWENYKAKRISLDEARTQITKLAGGIAEPDWVGSAAGTHEGAIDSSYQAELPGSGVSGGGAEAAAGRTGAGAAGGTEGDLNGTAASTDKGVFRQSGGLRGGDGVLAAEGGAHPGDGGAREADGSLRGLPRKVGGFLASAFGDAQRVAADYMARAGLKYDPPSTYAKVDPARAARIADAFQAMKHDPQDPVVKAAYAKMIDETAAQYQAVLDAGLKVEFVKGDDPYKGNPRAMTEDVRENNHMWVFSTRDGFGTDASFDPTDNPLLAETKFEIDGKPALANDLFRVVHDYFGHVKEGVGFRADGEENAWRAHMAMYSEEARRAATTETRGQNSWLNFGPHGETNRTAKVEDTHFADQKIGLLPEWVTNEGRADGEFEQAAYHGTPHTVDKFTTQKMGTGEGNQTFGWGMYFAGNKAVADFYRKTLSAGGKAGNTYKVEVPDDEHLLDYDAKLKDQPEAVRAALEKLGFPAEVFGVGKLNFDTLAEAQREIRANNLDVKIVRRPNPITGRDVYEELTRRAAPPELESTIKSPEEGASKVLDAAGVPGLRYRDQFSRGPQGNVDLTSDGKKVTPAVGDGGNASHNYVIFHDANVGDPEQLQQKARGTFSPSAKTITLLKDANLSTFQHELGHFFLDTLGHMAAQADAPAQVKADMAAFLKWQGIPDLDAWHEMSIDEQREHHEAFATGWETYLMRGQAPSLELRGLFSRMRAWMISVYKSLKGAPGDFTPEVRGVFDRLIASEDAIRQAEMARKYMPLFDSPEASGMSPEEWAAYQAKGKDATEQAIESLIGKTMKDMAKTDRLRTASLRAVQRDAAEKRKALTLEVRSEVMGSPVYRAWSFLTGKDSAQLPDEINAEHRQAMRDWSEKREEHLADIKPEIKAKAWADSPVSQEPHKNPGLAKGQWLAKNRARIDLEIQRQMLDYDAEHQKPVAPPVPDTASKDPTTGAGKIDLEALRAAVGKDKAKPLADLRMTTATGKGMQPGEVADMFGFPDVESLVKAITETEPPRAAVEGIVDQRMLERHGEISSPEAMAKTADELVQNEVRSTFVATELRALKKSIGKPKEIVAAAKEAAQNTIDVKRVRDINEGQFRAAETRSATQAEKAMMKGDTEGAATAKRDQLLNMELGRAARDAKEFVGKALEYLKKFEKDSVRELIDVDYRDQIDRLLERADLRKGVSGTALDKRASLEAWVAKMSDLGYEPDVPPELLNEAARWHYKDMPFEAFRGLVDSVKSIEQLGKLKEQLRDGQETRRIADLAEEVKASAAKLPQLPAESNRGLTRMEGKWLGAKAFGRSMQASLLKMEQMFDWLDARNSNGVLNRVVFQRMSDAGTHENEMLRSTRAGIDELVEKNLDEIAKTKQIFVADGLIDGKTGLPQKFTTKEMLMLAGNVGNESNLSKLVKGEGWNEQAVWDFLHKNMTPAHWDFVEGMGRTLETLWPAKVAMSRRLGMTTPEKIAPRPFQTADGKTRSGWYWPMMYDPARSQDVAERGARAGDQLFENIYSKANTDTGRLNTRNENYARPILLDLDALPKMVKDEIHDIAWREAVIDADRFLSHPVVRKAIVESLSQEHYDQIRPWLQSIANDGKLGVDGNRGWVWLNKVAAEARTRATMVGLGYRLTTGIVHGASAGMESIAELGPVWFAKGIADFGSPTQWAANKAAIFEKSGEMRNRADEVDRDVREHLRQIDTALMDPTSSAMTRGADLMRAHAYDLISGLDMLTALPTWQGAYLKGLSPIEKGGLGLGEQDAVYFADKTVRNAHGGTGVKDMAAIQRGNEFQKLFTMFYTFWNHNVNRLIDTAKLVGSSEHRAAMKEANHWSDSQLAATIITRTLVYTLGVQTMHAIFHPPKDGDEESWLKYAAKEIGAVAFGGIPIARDIYAHYATGKDYSATPAAGVIDTIGKAGTDAADALTGKEVNDKWLKHVIAAGGVAFNLPLGQPSNVAQFVWDIGEGRADPTSASDWYNGIMHGDVKHH